MYEAYLIFHANKGLLSLKCYESWYNRARSKTLYIYMLSAFYKIKFIIFQENLIEEKQIAIFFSTCLDICFKLIWFNLLLCWHLSLSKYFYYVTKIKIVAGFLKVAHKFNFVPVEYKIIFHLFFSKWFFFYKIWKFKKTNYQKV
jgi:hypothetical protein